MALVALAEAAAVRKDFAEALRCSGEAQTLVLHMDAEYFLEEPLRIWNALMDFLTRVDRIETGMRLGTLPMGGAAEELLCRRPAVEEELIDLWDSQRFPDLRRRLESLNRELETAAPDPCDLLYREALWAAAQAPSHHQHK